MIREYMGEVGVNIPECFSERLIKKIGEMQMGPSTPDEAVGILTTFLEAV